MHWFMKGVTNPEGHNYKIVPDGRNGKMLEPIGVVVLFAGGRERVHFQKHACDQIYACDLLPGEQAAFQELANRKQIIFPLIRFRTVNTKSFHKIRDSMTGLPRYASNLDYGAVNSFIYLGDGEELCLKIKRERPGKARHRKIMDKRIERMLSSKERF